MIWLLGWQRLAITLKQHCPQLTFTQGKGTGDAGRGLKSPKLCESFKCITPYITLISLDYVSPESEMILRCLHEIRNISAISTKFSH